jgi:hypothetical protein
MATTTTNYGFDIPQSTDLVKDGATAIATLGQDIDTAMNTALGTKKAGMVLLNTTSFSAVASQSFNDVFSTTYDNYRIVFEATCSANVTIDMRLRVSGADNSSANYWNNRTLGAGSTPQSFGASSAETSFLRVGEFETGISTGTYDVYSPFKTQITSLAGVNQFRYTSVYQHSCMKTGQTTVTTSYTGFTLFPSSGTMTGTVSVYGYNK